MKHPGTLKRILAVCLLCCLSIGILCINAGAVDFEPTTYYDLDYEGQTYKMQENSFSHPTATFFGSAAAGRNAENTQDATWRMVMGSCSVGSYASAKVTVVTTNARTGQVIPELSGTAYSYFIACAPYTEPIHVSVHTEGTDRTGVFYSQDVSSLNW